MCAIKVNEGSECVTYRVKESYDEIQDYVEDSNYGHIKATSSRDGYEMFFMKSNVVCVIND